MDVVQQIMMDQAAPQIKYGVQTEKPVDPARRRLANQRHELRRLNKKVLFTAARDRNWSRLVDLYRERATLLEANANKRVFNLPVNWAGVLFAALGLAAGFYLGH